MNKAVGLGLSGKEVPRLPGFIRSKPKAIAHSACENLTELLTWYSALDPVEQLLFTLMIGIPVSPRLYRALCEKPVHQIQHGRGR